MRYFIMSSNTNGEPTTKNKCNGDDTKAAARRSPNGTRKTKKSRRRKIFNMAIRILLPFATLTKSHLFACYSESSFQISSNPGSRGGVMTSYTISRCRPRRPILLPVLYLIYFLSSEVQNISTDQISSTLWLRYNYFRFGL